MSGFRIETAQLDWAQGQGPVSRRFGDVYFSAEDGLAETRHVFLGGCGLPEAWAGKGGFTIGETGFGSGLNFLAAWQSWRKTAPPGSRLHYVSVEGFPLSPADLKRVHEPWPELAELSQALLAVYPLPRPGFHRLLLDSGRVSLTLMLGEALNMLSSLEGRVDAWFLDGFAPSGNPDMWRPEVLDEIARLSAPDARLASFTVAGAVRRRLSEVGFVVDKATGFGRKREMLVARYQGAPGQCRVDPWYRQAPSSPRTVAVVGGGIAGCAVAEAFHRRGAVVRLYERNAQLMSEASGNPMGLVMPRLGLEPSPTTRFFLQAYLFALHRLQEIGGQAGFHPCGVLELARNETVAARHIRLSELDVLPPALMRRVDREEASLLAGIPLSSGGLFHASAGWLRPPDYGHALAKGVEAHCGVEVADLEALNADMVILANARAVRRFAPLSWLPLEIKRGQINLPPVTPVSAGLRCVVTYKGYLTPARQGRHCLGATYTNTEEDISCDSTLKDSDSNIKSLEKYIDGLSFPEAGEGRASLRCMTPDRVPLAGPAPDFAAYETDYARLRHGDRRASYPPARNHPGLYVLTGLGSRGMVTAPLAAEMLAAQVYGEPWPVEREVANLLHPGRFIIRGLRTRKAGS